MTSTVETTPVSSQALKKNLWSRIYSRVGTYWKGLALAIFFMTGAAVTQPTLAIAMKPLLDEGFSGTKPEYVWQVPLVIVGLILFRGVCNFFSDYLLAWVANNVLLGVRRDMFEKLLTMPDSDFKKGEQGWIVEVRDAVGMAEVLRKIANQPNVLNQFGRAARAHAEKWFNLNDFARQTLAVYQNCDGFER